MYPERCVLQTMDLKNATAKRHTLNKFMADKAFTETEDAVVICEGYILNKLQLFEKYGADTVVALVTEMYRRNGDEFFAEFRGGFAGAYYDKATDKWLVFTNQVGDCPVYYTVDANAFFAGSQVNYVIDACYKGGVKLNFNEQAAYQLMTHGYMIDDSTYANEIRRLVGGTYLLVKDGKAEIKTYHMFKKNKQRFEGKTDEELIEAIDKVFSAATKAEFNKDIEYGYAHLSDISGGLDARMTMWVAHSLGYGPMQLITYGKGNYLDETISKQIAYYWKDEILAKQIDDASYMYDIDEVVFMNGGLSFYSGISGGNRMLRSLNADMYGLEHSGINGNNTLSSYLVFPEESPKKQPTGRFSEKLVHRLSDKYRYFSDNFEGYEMYLNYTRAYRGITNTFQIRRNYTEVSAPFLDFDFIQLCFDIPVEKRLNYYIYHKWILRKYPEAAQFKWETTGAKITEPKLIGKIRRIVTKGPLKLLRIMGLGHKITTGMVPVGYWVSKDKKLKTFLDEYAQNGFDNPATKLSEQLVSDMKNLYAKGNITEKAMVLTVLGSVKLYFGRE